MTKVTGALLSIIVLVISSLLVEKVGAVGRRPE